MIAEAILIAGIGNIFMGDDAFGVEVARLLGDRALPSGVRVEDFGIRGLDLTYALLSGVRGAIIVDACPRDYAPGTLFVIEPEIPPETAKQSGNNEAAGGILMDAHGMDPVKVLRLVTSMGGHLERLLLVGCQPSLLDEFDEMSMGLSPPVKQAVAQAVPMIERLASEMLQSLKDIPVSPHFVKGEPYYGPVSPT